MIIQMKKCFLILIQLKNIFPNFNNKIKVITATIGKKPSKAKYFISDINDCIGILDSVTHTNFSNKFDRREHISRTGVFTPQIHLFDVRQAKKRTTLKDEDDLKHINTPRLFEDDDE